MKRALRPMSRPAASKPAPKSVAAKKAAAAPAPAAISSRPLFGSVTQLLAIPGLLLLTWVAYSNSFSTGFALDNQMAILHDARIQQVTADNVNLIISHTYWWPNGESGLYRPLTTLSYMWNYAVLGNAAQPAGYHSVNFVLHAANVVMVLLLALVLLEDHPRRFPLACTVAGLWAVHPVLTESVTNIVGRADLLAGAAVLSGFLMYVAAACSRTWMKALWMLGLSLVTMMGVFSKESAIVLPAIILCYELFYRRCRPLPWRQLTAAALAMAAPVGLMLWQRSIVLSAATPPEFPFVDNPIAEAGFWVGRLTALKVLGRYLGLAFFPVMLSSDYSYAQIRLVSGSLGDSVAWLAVAAAIAAAVLAWRHSRLAFFFAGFAFLNLLPAANLLFPIGAIMAERLLYVPLIGIVAAAVLGVDEALRRFPVSFTALAAVACIIGAAFAARTWTRNLDWTGDLTMAQASVRTSPDSFKTHLLLGVMLDEKDPNHANIDRVLAELDRSIAIIDPLPDRLDAASPWKLAAEFRLVKGDILSGDAARAQYEIAARNAHRAIAIQDALLADYDRKHSMQFPVSKDAAEAYRILASAYLRMHRPFEALDSASSARKIDPANPEAYAQIANAALAQHRTEEAAVTLAEGMFAANDSNLRSKLLELYQSGLDGSHCAIVPGPRGPALNPKCEIVHRDLCAAAARAGREDFARQLQCVGK